MTDLSLASAVSGGRAPTRRHFHPTVAVLVGAAVAGVALGHLGRPAEQSEASLVLLLRFMAALKGAAALGAAALLVWRERRATPLAPGSALAYRAALALMTLAPGLIAGLSHVAAGALCFHAGLILYAVAALRDDGLPQGLRRRA